jgi:hypothetical protein
LRLNAKGRPAKAALLFELIPKEKRFFDNILILILKELHDKLNAPVPATAAETITSNFPNNTTDQLAAQKVAFALYDDTVSAADLAEGFKQGKKCEAREAATLASLTCTGSIATSKHATAFSIRRAG